MAAAEQAQGSAHPSQEFLDSGGQKSMLELLSITDAAVKALNKSVRSNSSAGSHGSKKSDVQVPFTDPLVQSIHSDRSVKSSGSGHSVRSTQSGQLSGRSQNSGQSIPSHHSVHSSQSQEDNNGAKPALVLQDLSHDSGVVSKTQTVTDNTIKPRETTQTGSPEGASDVSTTASDVLVQSTHEKSTHINNESGLLENVSSGSKYSKTSFGVENFNSSGPQKVKISKRRLKEIKAPFNDDEGLRGSTSSDEKVPSSLLSEDGRSKRGSRTNSESGSKSGKSETGSQNGKHTKTGYQFSNSDGSVKSGSQRNGNFPKGFESDQFRVEKVRKSSEKAYDDVNMATRNGHNGTAHQQTNAARENALKSDKQRVSNGTNNEDKIVVTDVNQLRSTPKYFVERHTPQKGQTKAPDVTSKADPIPERKNLLKDLEDSIEIVTTHAKDSSTSSSQPEIITVPERIVTVTAADAGSPASRVSQGVAGLSLSQLGAAPSVSQAVAGTSVAPPLVSYHSAGHKLRDDKGITDTEKPKGLDDSDIIPPALPRQFKRTDDLDLGNHGDNNNPSKTLHSRSQWFSKQATGHGLLQGAPVNGHDAPDRQKDEDIHISDFKLTDKQRLVKENFARRQGGPIRRVVQPRLVGHDSKASSTSSVGEHKQQQQQVGQSNDQVLKSNDQVLTAAAAASAAVAATQPFLKAQYEMEAKMAELVEKINELQKTGGVKTNTQVEGDRVQQLERQLTDVTEKRIEYMEKLQEQQMAMQAKLLSLTRDASSKSQSRPAPSSPESHIYIHSDSQKPSTTTQNKAFSKTTVHRHPVSRGDYSDRVQKYSSVDQDESMSPLHTPAPRSRAPKPTVYDTSDISYRSRAMSPKARSPKARSPKAKSPKSKTRSRSKSPYKENQDTGILHQILASSHSPPVRDVGLQPPRQPVLQERNYRKVDSPNVKKAKALVEDLSAIKDQVKNLAEDKEKWSQVSFTEPQDKPKINKAVEITQHSHTDLSHVGPAPLDSYLKMPEKEPCSPYKTVPDLSFSHFNAPLLPGFKDAESILRQVQKNRGILEANLETVFKGRKEVEVYNVLETLYNDSTNKDLGHIQKMVDGAISKLRREVEREVTDDMVIAVLKKKQQTSVPGAAKMPEPAPAKPAGRYGIRNRLQEQKREPKVEPKKQPVKRPVTSTANRPQYKKAAKSMFENEDYMTQIYGKASYQKGRTTVKDPYLHFQNTAKPKPARPAAVKEVRGKEVMSSKTQTGQGAVRQFYFNPNTGTYIPIASMDNIAPIPGQLIPMAVPLGGPRMDSGVSIPTQTSPPSGPLTFDQGQIQASGNVAMVSVEVDEDPQRRSLTPKRGKQAQPAVEEDSDISEVSDVMDERPSHSSHMTSHMTPERPKKTVQIISPKQTPDKTPGRGGYDGIYQEESAPSLQTEGVREEESSNSNTNSHQSFTQSIHHADHDQHSDDTIVDEDDDVETAPGVELPGYQPTETPDLQYNGPAFPPRQPSTDRQMTSELIAQDIRRRDLLQNQANDWLEQELMARIITEIYPLKDKEEPAELSHVVSEMSEDSMAEEREQSAFIMDSIGHRGMQLFIDAGYPVDNGLVNNLVKEVLQEKIRTMLGQRPDQQGETEIRQDVAEDQYEQDWEEPVSEDLEEPTPRTQTVRTLDPTPKTSPASSPPPQRTSMPLTPPASPRPIIVDDAPRDVQETIEPEMYPPPAQPVQQPTQPVYEPESEPESSASYDIKEEMNRLADQLRPAVDTSASFQSRHDIATPPESPKPRPQTANMPPLTPPDLSPRPVEEGFTMSQRAMHAGMAVVSGKGSPHVSKSDTPQSPTSAQVLEMPEEIMDDQPKPVMFSVAGTQTEVVEETRKPRSPSPARDKSRSRSPSESSITESSSISDTYNENISEGQWLINKSDGEMADFPVDPNVVRNRLLRTSQRRVDVSSASTWKDADDIDLEEMTDVSKSEGEFLYRTDMPPEKDPVLHMLARLQHDAPQYGMYNLSNKQVTDVLNATGKSEGEVIRVVPQQQQQQQQMYQQQQYEQQPPFNQQLSRPFYKHQQQQQQQQMRLPFQQEPQPTVIQSEPVRSKSPHARSGSSHPKRTQSPSFRTQSPTRVSFEDEVADQRSVSPTRGILKQTSSYDNQRRPMREEDFDRPVRDRDMGRSTTPTGRLTPGGRQPQAKGMITAGGRTSPMKSKSRSKPPQVIRSNTLPESRGSGTRLVNVRGSSDDYRDSFENTGGPSYYGTGSEYGTRTMTPDQMNMDALIQSGYLSQSFSQSENGKQTGRSSVRSSADLRLSRTSASGGSLGLAYGTDGSLTESELQRLATHGTGKLQMSLTLPGADGMDESDVSEVDISSGRK